MNQPAKIDIRADRWVACIRQIPFVNADFTGATFISQVRLYGDASGSPLVDLSTVTLSTAEGVRLVYAGTDTVANHIAAGRLSGVPSGYESTDSVAVSLVGIRINETTMEGLPFPQERGTAAEFVWDLQITPTGGIKDKYVGGAFMVEAGATQ